MNDRLKEITELTRDELLTLVETQAQLLQKIADTVNLVPTITGLSPVSDFNGIPLAIRDLQECYRDAATARNFGPSLTETGKKLKAAEALVETQAKEIAHFRQQRDWLIEQCGKVGVAVNVAIGAPIEQAYRLENTAESKLSDAQERVKVLEKYAQHSPDCKMCYHPDFVCKKPRPCTCGLNAALRVSQ